MNTKKSTVAVQVKPLTDSRVSETYKSQLFPSPNLMNARCSFTTIYVSSSCFTYICINLNKKWRFKFEKLGKKDILKSRLIFKIKLNFSRHPFPGSYEITSIFMNELLHFNLKYFNILILILRIFAGETILGCSMLCDISKRELWWMMILRPWF